MTTKSLADCSANLLDQPKNLNFTQKAVSVIDNKGTLLGLLITSQYSGKGHINTCNIVTQQTSVNNLVFGQQYRAVTATNMNTELTDKVQAYNEMCLGSSKSNVTIKDTLLNTPIPSDVKKNNLTHSKSNKLIKSEASNCAGESSMSSVQNQTILSKKESVFEERLKKYKVQLKKREENGDYFCMICHIEYGNQQFFNGHEERTSFVCRICFKEISSHKELECHFEKHLSYDCVFCEQVCFSKSDLIQHQEGKHGNEKSFKCDSCDKCYFKKKSLQSHKSRVHENKTNEMYKCVVCGQSFKMRSVLNSHGMNCHSAYEYMECKYCQKLILGPEKLKDHMKYHIDSERNRPASCHPCGKVFKRMSILVKHQEKHHKTAESVCELCGISVKNELERKLHMKKKHAKTGSFKCKYCNEMFSNELLLATHVVRAHRTRKAPTSVFCEVCGKLFKNKQILDNHKRIHSDERPFKCDVCNATFRQSVALRTHSRVHSDVGVYNCVNCGKDFKWKQTFDKHVKTCTSEQDEDNSSEDSV